MSWVKWDKILVSFENGGLNIGRLKAFNIALVLNWKWRYLTKPDDLWDIDSVMLSDREDCWSCLISVDGIYTVKSVRDYIDHKILPVSNSKTSWYKFLPRKVNVFLWRFRLDSLSVRWNLSAKGIDINSVVCPVCTNGVETCDHLFSVVVGIGSMASFTGVIKL
ncbi:uncharacterized protein [Rutidosis leptorrhynchoides]|uniref:uncharacterized protein n=1 Tax=Rutidosis leptorrhynchoides TaxID=125765 RepID=UPI003A9A347A